jgi:hypothetical protein
MPHGVFAAVYQWGGGFTFNRLENVFGTESVLKTVNLKSSVRRNLPVD